MYLSYTMVPTLAFLDRIPEISRSVMLQPSSKAAYIFIFCCFVYLLCNVISGLFSSVGLLQALSLEGLKSRDTTVHIQSFHYKQMPLNILKKFLCKFLMKNTLKYLSTTSKSQSLQIRFRVNMTFLLFAFQTGQCLIR